MSVSQPASHLLPTSRSLKRVCFICEAIKKGGVTPRFKELFPNLPNQTQILFKARHFFLIPDDSPVVENHLLAVSRNHALSCAGLSKEEFGELLELREYARIALETNYHGWLYFEHGTGKTKEGEIASCGACFGVEHAHQHFLPIPQSIDKNRLFQYLTKQVQKEIRLLPIKLNTPWELLWYKEKPYLYIEVDGKKHIFFPSEEDASVFIPSQFIRYLVGYFFKVPVDHWDLTHLHTHHRDLEKKRIMETVKKFKQYGIQEKSRT